jgi:hypothetical protein
VITLIRITIGNKRLGDYLSQCIILRGVLEIKLEESGHELNVGARILNKEQK